MITFLRILLSAYHAGAFGRSASERQRFYKFAPNEEVIHLLTQCQLQDAAEHPRLMLISGILYFTPGPVIDALRRHLYVQGQKLPLDQHDLLAQLKSKGFFVQPRHRQGHQQKFGNSRPKDARRWYESAAQQNSAEGQFQLGNLLLTGRSSTLPDQGLTAEPAAGLSSVYSAATNGYQGAWKSLARCLQTGSNCATNLPEAYAWLNLLAEVGDTASRTEMNRLALDLSSENIQAGKSILAAMKLGQWPAPPFAENSRIDRGLRIQGVAISPKEKLVIIGNRTLAEGE